jgi:hypothetical protein
MNITAPLMLQSLKVSGMKLAPPAPGTSPEATDLIPDELRDWLVRLRLLHDVPFAYFVADTQLLPEESIRWFYVDRRWTDALVQGALSVGTVNTDDRLQLTERYGEIRNALDTAERNVRRREGDPFMQGAAGPISGFILRSRAVSGWPGLHVRAFKEEPTEGDGFDYPDNHPQRMRLLRLERLAPAVLLCLFDGIPKEVHIQEPRQGVQFGVIQTVTASGMTATVPVRNPTAGIDETGQNAVVRFRPNAAGVVDIQRLETELANKGGAGPDGKLDSAEYALQMIRFPYRQIYGRPDRPNTDVVLRPTVRYVTLASVLFQD